MNDSLYSLEIEKYCIGGLLKFPEVFSDIDSFVVDEDFYQPTHRNIYSVIKQQLLKNKKINNVLIAQELSSLQVKSEVPPLEYLNSLLYTQITKDATIENFRALSKLRVCRELFDTSRREQKFIIDNVKTELGEIISGVDQIHNDKIVLLAPKTNQGINIYEHVEQLIEGRVKNPPDESDFLMGPFPTVNRIYGSLLRPSGITICAARSGIGKTAKGMFYTNWVAEKYDIPIIHLDFSEMTAEELQFRAICMLSKGKVTLHSLEHGYWNRDEKTAKLVRSLWPRVKKMTMVYYDIGSMKPVEIINLIRRFYYNKVGKGNRFIVHYDYLKPFNFDPKMAEYREMGFFIQQIKTLINNEVPASFWASLQVNRAGITTNRNSSQIDDSENVFAISDRIMQQATHAFLLRPKLSDELELEQDRFGNLQLLCVKHRHLGEDYKDAIDLVKVNGKYKKNYINLKGYSFYYEDKGDLKSIARALEEKADIQDDSTESDTSADLL